VGEAVLRSAVDLAPDVIVVSGDLTQRAKCEQFQQAREFLDRLPDVPLVIVPGNHDVPLYRVRERWSNPHGLYREYIRDKLNDVLHVDGAVIVSLDSTAPHTAITNGRIRRAQLDFCTQALAGTPEDAARIVVAHHHFAPAPDTERDSSMPQAKRAINHFTDLGVDLILGGHLHRAYIGNSLDLYAGKHRERGIIIVQSGTTTSRRGRAREREKNTFNLIQVGPEMLQVTHFMHFHEDDGFGPVSRHLFPRHGKRFVDPAEAAAMVRAAALEE
jgi:DNA repair exonuclease SbcCD nuclease subunit